MACVFPDQYPTVAALGGRDGHIVCDAAGRRLYPAQTSQRWRASGRGRGKKPPAQSPESESISERHHGDAEAGSTAEIISKKLGMGENPVQRAIKVIPTLAPIGARGPEREHLQGGDRTPQILLT